MIAADRAESHDVKIDVTLPGKRNDNGSGQKLSPGMVGQRRATHR